MPVGLYQHQKEAVQRLRPGSVLCGGVGTGKSRTAIAYFFEKICGGKLETLYSPGKPMVDQKRLYVITTARKRDTLEWTAECIPFGLTVQNGKRGTADVVVDSWNNIKKYVNVENAFFIFDEQRVVGKGAWVKSFLQIAKRNPWILLTATPGDSWMDYVPIFIANGFYKNRTEFISRHVVYYPFRNFPKVKCYLDTAYLEKLRDKVVIEMTYEKRATKHHRWVKCPYNTVNYEMVNKKRWDIFKDEPIGNVARLCYLLRRVTNEAPERLRVIRDIFDRHHRVIVFYNFDYELDELRRFSVENQIIFSEWNGHKHQPIPDTPEWLYLVQYSAGAEGWNCTRTDTIAFMSLNYSYKTLVQACGRVDRLNTPYTDLYYYHICSDSPIDKAISHCLSRKKDFNETIFASRGKNTP